MKQNFWKNRNHMQNKFCQEKNQNKTTCEQIKNQWQKTKTNPVAKKKKPEKTNFLQETKKNKKKKRQKQNTTKPQTKKKKLAKKKLKQKPLQNKTLRFAKNKTKHNT